jgi:hypothetical protein
MVIPSEVLGIEKECWTCIVQLLQSEEGHIRGTTLLGLCPAMADAGLF